MMNSELGRCRRTDGKKWRCSKDVVLNQKYCERHMHRGRGRKRSRKPVESSKFSCPDSTAPDISLSEQNQDYAVNPINNIYVSVPASLKIQIPSSNCTVTRDNANATTNTCSNYKGSNGFGGCKDTTTNPTTTITMATSAMPINNANKSKKIDGGDGKMIFKKSPGEFLQAGTCKAKLPL